MLRKHGPKFISDCASLPDQNLNLCLDGDSEVKVTTKTLVTDISDSCLDKLMCSVSTWWKLKCRIASLLRLRNSLLNSNKLKKGYFTVSELKNAEICIYKYFQSKYFLLELDCLKGERTLPRKSKLCKLRPFLDDNGLIRVGGRLNNSDFEYNTKFPLVLPTSFVSDLIIRDTHERVGHLGRETVLAELRKNYWIFKANVSVRKLVKNCVLCRKLHGKTSQQVMSELPARRVCADTPAFTHVGTDNFGPFLVVQGRKTVKRYGVIFVCMSSRAVHIEISHSLSTDSFVNALRRFICRRGNVQSITSDNGTNLVAADKEIKESVSEWNLEYIGTALAQRNIDWYFNTPSASHFGGFYERLIRSIRKVFNALLNCQNVKLYDEELLTLMCEVECVLNNRPLTDVPDDPRNVALTPNHLLLLNAGITFPPGLFNKDESYVKRRWRQVQYLVEQFWSRWRREYLVLLQQRQKWFVETVPHKIGDLVLVVDLNMPRNQWPLGRIVAVETSKDGKVRSASVRISKCINFMFKGFETTVIDRPIVKLILLRSVEDL